MGGITDTFFGGEEKTETSQRVHLPSYAKEPFKKALRKAESAADIPFERFPTENRIADFTDDELEAFELTRDLVGRAAPQILESRDQLQPLVRQGLEGLDQELIEANMDPYVQNVLDARRTRFLDDIDRQRRTIQQRQGAIGAFGGSRSAVAEEEALREAYEGLNQMEAEEMSRAFQQAQGVSERGLTRAGQAAMDRANLANLATQRQFQDIGALSGIGAQQRSLEQARRDFDFSEFAREEADPRLKAGFLSQIATPMASVVAGRDATKTQTTTPGLGQVALQAAGAMMGGGASGMPSGGNIGPGLMSNISNSLGSTFAPSAMTSSFSQGTGGVLNPMFGPSTPVPGRKPSRMYKGGLAEVPNSYAEGGVVENAISSFGRGLDAIRQATRTRRGEADEGFDLQDIQEFITSPFRLGEGLVGLASQPFGSGDQTRARDVLGEAANTASMIPLVGVGGFLGRGGLEASKFGGRGLMGLKNLVGRQSLGTKGTLAALGLGGTEASLDLLDAVNQESPSPAERHIEEIDKNVEEFVESGDAQKEKQKAQNFGNKLRDTQKASKDSSEVNLPGIGKASINEAPKPLQGPLKKMAKEAEKIDRGEEGELSTVENFNKLQKEINQGLSKAQKQRGGLSPSARRWLAFAAGAGKGRNFSESLGNALGAMLNEDQRQKEGVLSKEEAVRSFAAQEAGLPLEDLRVRNQRKNIEAQELRNQLAVQEANDPLQRQLLEARIAKYMADANPTNQQIEALKDTVQRAIPEFSNLGPAQQQKSIDNIIETQARVSGIPPAQLAQQAEIPYGKAQSTSNQQQVNTSGFNMY